MTVDPEAVLARFYPPDSPTLALLRCHGRQVAAKALAVADRVAHLKPDRRFLFEAAMLHDVGIFQTDAPDLGCFGPSPYVCHGILGGRLLADIGLPRHGLVCERHVGTGLSAEEIRARRLPLPERDLRPVSLEEEIICYADKFFSKNGRTNGAGRSVAQVVALLAAYGPEQVARFRRWAKRFEVSDAS
ncbi:MAG: phosphohydrolase [Desulfobacterales bacterium]|nr:phosphohydrolase [Desulfobacterales bacterium]